MPLIFWADSKDANVYIFQTHLFLPYFLQHSLIQSDMSAALSLCQHFSHLSYFAHALEILLHHVLDDEVDNESRSSKISDPAQKHQPLLPLVISFLQSSLPARVYLDIVVQCTRKTELRSWRTLFTYLPPPKDLFEQALRLDSLKTAVGYLLVLQAFEDEEDGHDTPIEDYVVRLIGLASQRSDWELCAELARFLISLDASGEMLRRAIARTGLRNGAGMRNGLNGSATSTKGLPLAVPIRTPSWSSLSPTSSPIPLQSGRAPSDQESSASGGNMAGSVDSGVDDL